MAKSRRDAGLIAAAGAVLLLLGLLAYPPVAFIGAAVAIWGGIQWLMFANRDIHRQPPQD